MIEKLERELSLTKKELELNAEFTFLQSSMSNSAFQSQNSQLNNKKQFLQNNFPSLDFLPKKITQTQKNNRKIGKIVNEEEQNKEKQDESDDEYDDQNSSKQDKINIMKKNNTNHLDFNTKKQRMPLEKLESSFNMSSIKEENAIRTSRQSKKDDISNFEENYEQQLENDDDTLAQLSDNSDNNMNKNAINNQVKENKQQINKQNNKILEKSKNSRLISSRNQKQNKEFDLDEIYGNSGEENYSRSNETSQYEEEEMEQDYQKHKQQQNKSQSFQSDQESNNSMSGEINVKDDEFSENDSIDQEVKRRLKEKQMQKTQQQNSKNDTQTNYQIQQSSIHYDISNKKPEIKIENKEAQNPRNIQKNSFHKSNQSKERISEDQDSDEILERNAKQIRELQKKRNQEKI